MNQEEYYLNQDMTTECILLPNLFQQGDCLIKQNYLSELSQNPGRALLNLGLDPDINNKVISLLECCDTVRLNITNIVNNIAGIDIVLLRSDVDNLKDNIVTTDDVENIVLNAIEEIDKFIPINNEETSGSYRLPEIYIKGKDTFTVDAEKIYFKSLNFTIDSTTGVDDDEINTITINNESFAYQSKKDNGGRTTVKYIIGTPTASLTSIQFQSKTPLLRIYQNNGETITKKLLEDQDLENYLIKNTNVNQGDVNILVDEFKISSPLTITDDSTLLKYNDDELITYNNLKQLIFNSSKLYKAYPSGNAIIYDSENFNADTIKVYKTKLEGDIISNEDSFKNALLKLENAIKNLPSGGGSGECDCPELPGWVTPDKPDFGEKNVIETIELNGNRLSVTNKTVNIRETIIGANGGLEIDDNRVVKHTNSVINDTLPSSEILCKIKFDRQGHIISYSKVTSQELFDMLKNILDEYYEPNSSRQAVTSITITNTKPIDLTDNKNTELLEYTTNGTNKNVTWASSDDSVVTVDNNGQILAVSSGTATITATLINSSLETGIISDDIIVNVTLSAKKYYIGTNNSNDYITTSNYSSMINLSELPNNYDVNNQYLYIITPIGCELSITDSNNFQINLVTLNNNNKYTSSETQVNESVYVYRSAQSISGQINIQLSYIE